MGTEPRGGRGAKDTSPDAGAYNPSINYAKPGAPSYKMGSGARGDNFDSKKAANEPGPGNYELKSAAFNDKVRFHYG